MGFCVFRVRQLEDENSDISMNMCRLKSQTEKLDEVSHVCIFVVFYPVCVFFILSLF